MANGKAAMGLIFVVLATAGMVQGFEAVARISDQALAVPIESWQPLTVHSVTSPSARQLKPGLRTAWSPGFSRFEPPIIYSDKKEGADPNPIEAPSETQRRSSRADDLRTWPVPKPAPASRKDLPAAFTKPTPASVADLKAIEQQIKAVVQRVTPSVVAVEVGYGSGTGVVISEDGLVLTAGHVCGRPNREVRFTFSGGKTARGRTLGVEQDSDTGLMRITDPGPWPHVAVGDIEQARVGDWVLALGHPGGFDVKRSLVVRLGRIIGLAPEIVQTDCTISPGDSGGPLFDAHGRVIGIHSAISRSVAENYHVPISEFYEHWEQLVSGGTGHGARPWAYLGAGVQDESGECTVTEVEPDGPAFKAGLKTGDVILKVEGRQVLVSASLQRWIAEAQPGETLKLEIKRGDKQMTLEVKLQPEPAEP